MKVKDQIIYVILMVCLITIVIFGFLEMIIPILVLGFCSCLLGIMALINNKQ